ncbi:MAG TPA: GNAT family N-acetyltransferase [Gemmatimonadaceae bacterium]|nr:GNAT family N-acetyltransferase [Gemmatimonadaceae bacterium]
MSSSPPPSADITVRRASADDLDDVATLFDDYRAFYGRPRDLAGARAFLAERLARQDSVILVASVNRIVAFAQLYAGFSSLSMGHGVILNDLFVAPSARRLGVANRLVDASIAHGRETGALYIELATQRTNHNAQRLYLAKGFHADEAFIHMSRSLDARRS